MWLVGAASGPRLHAYQYWRGSGLRKELFANAQPSEDHANPVLPTQFDDRHQRIPDRLFWVNVLQMSAVALRL